MTMKSFCFRVKNGTYRLNFGIENDALRSRGLLLVKPDRFPKVEITLIHILPLESQLPYLGAGSTIHSSENTAEPLAPFFYAPKCTLCAPNDCKTAWLEGLQKTAILLIGM